MAREPDVVDYGGEENLSISPQQHSISEGSLSKYILFSLPYGTLQG